MNLNKVTIAGNLTRDPELRYTPKGTAICKIGVAVNRQWKGEGGEKKEEVTFVDVDFWGKTAEHVGQYFRKGRPIYLEGRLKLDSWDDKTSGQKRQKLTVTGESFQFVGGKGDAPTQEQAEMSTTGQAAPNTQASGIDPDSDVPF